MTHGVPIQEMEVYLIVVPLALWPVVQEDKEMQRVAEGENIRVLELLQMLAALVREMMVVFASPQVVGRVMARVREPPQMLAVGVVRKMVVVAVFLRVVAFLLPVALVLFLPLGAASQLLVETGVQVY